MGSIGASFHVQRSNVRILGNLYGVGVYIDDTPVHAVTLERFGGVRGYLAAWGEQH